jgi:DNA-binding transcriptional regulator YdaS (Cro superfamily)
MRVFSTGPLPDTALTPSTVCALIGIMSKEALLEACKAVGGQTALARLLDLGAQSTVSSWLSTRLPAERVLAVEAVTGVSRHRLRPDLYPMALPSENASRKRAGART